MIEPFTIFEILNDAAARLGICRMPGGLGDLDHDVAIIAAWRPSLVISMTETEEMTAAGSGGLPAALAALGIAHAAFPIRDFGVPEQADKRWPKLSRLAHALLDQGGSILLHCMGGRGRSGMVALRLLSERDLSPAAALALIREARPGAVETVAQEQWGADGKPVSRIMPPDPH